VTKCRSSMFWSLSHALPERWYFTTFYKMVVTLLQLSFSALSSSSQPLMCV